MQTFAWIALCLVIGCRSSESPPAAGSASGAPEPAGSAAPPAAPAAEAPAARQLAAWLAAFNTIDRAAITAYRTKQFVDGPLGELGNADRDLDLAQITGGFDVRKTEESTPTRVVAVVKERSSDQHARVAIDVEAAAPHRVRGFQIGAIPTPEELRAPRLAEAAAVAALRAELARVVAADRFSGAVIVAKQGTPLLAEAVGLADRAAKTPNKLDTRFRIGSMNKMFTATATLRLVQAGKLALTDRLAKILPQYPNKQLAAKVTIHHLLTHTGGTGDIFGPEFDKHRLELRTHQDYVKLYGARDLKFEPGARFEYSNYGFLLLGVVIEKVTGQSYYDAVAKLVYEPAGMTATASPIEGIAAADRSVGYMRPEPAAGWKSAADTLPYRGTSAGGGDSTVSDLLRFATALTSHKILDAAHFALLTTGKIEAHPGSRYAYGFIDEKVAGVRCFGHGGGAPGMNGDLQICESGYTIAVLANVDPPAAGRLADFIKLRLPAN